LWGNDVWRVQRIMGWACIFTCATNLYHYGSDIVGSFGFAGIAGILCHTYIGKMADRYSPRIVVLVEV
ncbi:hypothetical protein J4734_25855, partial [Klebsiella pneumoniae]|nr:hypothetical protein [Klebsiella pneumoniae]